MNQPSHTFRNFIVVYFSVIIFVIGVVVGGLVDQPKNPELSGQLLDPASAQHRPDFLSQDVDFALFWNVWQTIRENYIDTGQVSDSQLFYGALKGLVAGLDDDHSNFLDPQVNKDFADSLEGTFEGIGAEITIKKSQLLVVTPLADSPAQAAGLKAGDYILAIDDQETAGLSLDYAVSLIKGPAGSQVRLAIFRPSTDESLDMTITRKKIEFSSVRWEMRPDNLFYVEIMNFHKDTVPLFRQAVQEILNKNPQGIIIDLRGNPGGFFDSSIDVAGEWIDQGVIVSEGDQDSRHEFKAQGQNRLADFPTVVLINEGSASASEIVAGALHDHGKATLVGKKTFGKGSIQELFELTDGSAIKLTTARWFTPNGVSIDKNGISPDVEVDLTQDDFDNDRDPQLDKAVEILLAR